MKAARELLGFGAEWPAGFLTGAGVGLGRRRRGGGVRPGGGARWRVRDREARAGLVAGVGTGRRARGILARRVTYANARLWPAGPR
jgi:hypothetical protein